MSKQSRGFFSALGRDRPWPKQASAISDQERHIKKGKSKVEEVFAVLHRRSEESLWTRESAGGGGGDADDASDMFVWEKKGARN